MTSYVLNGRVKGLLLFPLLLLAFLSAKGQTLNNSGSSLTGSDVRMNTITTAVPFLMITPDSRSGAMGDAGVAISPDANAIHWNPSKLAFAPNEMEISVSYVPWLRELVNDINLAYLSGYKRIDETQSFGASLRYFSMGNITFRDRRGNKIRDFNPNEFALDMAYARKFSELLSGGLAARYVYSNLTGGTTVGGASSKPGQSVAADVSLYFRNDNLELAGKEAIFSAGLNISNIGAKMSYTNTENKDFIPINMRLGPNLDVDLDEYNRFSLTFDLNKLLVPTPPLYKTDSNGQPVIQNGQRVVAAGRNPDVGVASGIFGSFSDAPGTPIRDDNGNVVYGNDGKAEVEDGSVFKEEMREISIASGMEYWYDQQFAIRAGYFYEHASKGNRKFVTLGAGLRYSVFSLDFSYLIPTEQRNPLANTLRFTLRFSFEDLDAQKKENQEKGS